MQTLVSQQVATGFLEVLWSLGTSSTCPTLSSFPPDSQIRAVAAMSLSWLWACGSTTATRQEKPAWWRRRPSPSLSTSMAVPAREGSPCHWITSSSILSLLRWKATHVPSSTNALMAPLVSIGEASAFLTWLLRKSDPKKPPRQSLKFSPTAP